MKRLIITIILIILFCIFVSCEKEYKYGNISFYTNDNTILPVYIYLNNMKFDTITDISHSTSECNEIKNSYELISDNYYDFTFYGKNFKNEIKVKVINNQCNKFNIKE